MTAEMPMINAVGINNLLDVQDLSFKDLGQTIDIQVIFKNGGVLDFNYEKSGKLNKLKAQNGVETSINTELGEITYRMKKSS
ncbi:hypothetical protein [Aeromonas salmonicida]